MALSKAGARAISEAQTRRWAAYRKEARKAYRATNHKTYERRKPRSEVMQAFQTLGRYLKRQSL